MIFSDVLIKSAIIVKVVAVQSADETELFAIVLALSTLISKLREGLNKETAAYDEYI